MKSRRKAGWLRVAAWNAGLFVAGLVAVELAFGNWIFGPNLGLLAVPRHVEIEHVLEHLPGRPVARYTRDGFGLRGAYRNPEDIDVLVVGGSTTNELYVGDGETFVDVMRDRLAAAGRPLTIVNAGVDGHSTVGHLRAFEVWFSRIPGLTPRWVMFYAGLNEAGIGGEARHDESITERRRLPRRIARAIRNNSAVYQLFRTIRGAIRARERRIVHGADIASTTFPVAIGADEVAARKRALLPGQADALRQYRARLRRLVEKTRALGARPVFVTQRRGDVRLAGKGPNRSLKGATGSALTEQLRLENLNDVTLDVCRETATVCIDLGRELDLANGDFYDAVHTTPAGSRRIGEYLAEKLAAVFGPD